MVALRKIFRNTLFRLSLLGAFLFVLSLFAALGYVYWATVSSELRRVDQSIAAEIAEIQSVYDVAGRNAIVVATETGLLPEGIASTDPRYKNIYDISGANAVSKTINVRMLTYDSLYYLNSPHSTGGNLADTASQTDAAEESIVPGLEGTRFTKFQFIYASPRDTNAQGEPIDLRARGISGFLTQNGETVAGIVVGRDVEAIMRTGERVRTAILTSAGIALLLGLISSFFVSRRFTRRVESFNRLATDVRAGHLDRRAPRNYSEDEMDMLAEHLNAMLDHINRLMQAMRYAGDSVAHDLRTPLTRLRTRLETAAVDLGDSKTAETLHAAADDADQLLTTFDSVLRIARLEAGEQRELRKPLDPKLILDDMAELYEPACEDKGLTFAADISPKMQILADRGLLSQAVSNLLENAIKYTPDGGSIRLIGRKTKGGRVEIAIVDDGPGIPSWDRERVKERFVRLDKSRSLPGSGLGLALVDAVAELHDAEFVMSDNENQDPELAQQGRPGLKAALIFPRIKGKSLPNDSRLSELGAA